MGFIAAVFSVVPLCFLILIPHDVFVAKNQLIKNAVNKAKQLEKDNEQLREELTNYQSIVDAMLNKQLRS